MAKSKNTTSRPKLAKTEVKRSAPVQLATPVADPKPESQWFISPPPSILGGELLKQLKRAVGTYRILDERGSPKRSERAHNAVNTFAKTLALVQPKGAVEALAAAILIQDDLGLVANGATDFIKRDAAERIEQRVASLASWIECTHKVDRREWGLDFFCKVDSESRLIPHAARTLHVDADHDR